MLARLIAESLVLAAVTLLTLAAVTASQHPTHVRAATARVLAGSPRRSCRHYPANPPHLSADCWAIEWEDPRIPLPHRAFAASANPPLVSCALKVRAPTCQGPALSAGRTRMGCPEGVAPGWKPTPRDFPSEPAAL